MTQNGKWKKVLEKDIKQWINIFIGDILSFAVKGNINRQCKTKENMINSLWKIEERKKRKIRKK